MVALLLAVAGVVAAWRCELSGEVLAIAGSVAIVLLVALGSGLDGLVPAVVFVTPLVLAGLLYLGCSARCRAKRQRGAG
jgi:hypothetical protein